MLTTFCFGQNEMEFRLLSSGQTKNQNMNKPELEIRFLVCLTLLYYKKKIKLNLKVQITCIKRNELKLLIVSS